MNWEGMTLDLFMNNTGAPMTDHKWGIYSTISSGSYTRELLLGYFPVCCGKCINIAHLNRFYLLETVIFHSKPWQNFCKFPEGRRRKAMAGPDSLVPYLHVLQEARRTNDLTDPVIDMVIIMGSHGI